MNLKDSATRIQHEVEENRQRRRAAAEREAQELQAREAEFEAVKTDFFRLFSETNPQRRGKALESVLNRLFRAYGILVREAFTLVGSEGEGVVEQIDGVIELGGDLFLVEMKWWSEPLGPGDVALHMTRVFGRGQVRGLFIAHPGFTDAAVLNCKSFLHMAPFVLCELEELVRVLNERADLTAVLKAKLRATQIDKQPLFRGWTA